MNRALPIAFLFLASVPLYPAMAQQVRGKDLMTDLTRSMHGARIGKPDISVLDEQIRNTDPIAFIRILDTYLEEDSEEVRRNAYFTMARTARIHATPNVGQAVVDRLVAGFDDPSPEVQDAIMRTLPGFLARDFTPQAKERLRQLAHTTSPPEWKYLKYLGIAGIDEEISFVNSLLGSPQKIFNVGDFETWGRTLEFDALLVLARLGDDRAARRAVELVDSEPTMRDKFGDSDTYLAYTRHPIAVEYIVQNILLSNEKMGPGSRFDYPAAWGAATTLSRMLENFPSISEKADQYKQYRGADLEAVRAWARQQTTWVLKK